MADVWNHGLIGILFPEDAPVWTLLFVLIPIAVGYLLGSVNTSILLSKFVYHDDIRKYGSGNAGTTNVMRTWGKGAAAATLVGDLAKTALAVIIGRLLMGETGMYLGGFAAVCGHVWPCFFGFRGGKGVAAALALVLFTEPIVALILLGVFICIVAATKYIHSDTRVLLSDGGRHRQAQREHPPSDEGTGEQVLLQKDRQAEGRSGRGCRNVRGCRNGSGRNGSGR